MKKYKNIGEFIADYMEKQRGVMILEDLLGKINNEYVDVFIKGMSEYSEVWKIDKGKNDFSYIPDKELKSKVYMITPYHDRLEIIIEKY